MTDGNPPTLTASGHERIQTIDVLRGLALFGIIVVNAWFFGFPMMKATGELDMDTNGADTAARFVVTAFFQFKFISIFSILFGFGIAMQHSRLIERTGSAAGFLARRMIILAMFGLVHAIGIWYGDILFQYAIVGMMMILLIQIPSGIRLTLGIVCMAVSMLAIFGFGMLSMIETPVVADPDLSLRGFEAMRAARLRSRAARTGPPAEIAANREGPCTDAFLFRIDRLGLRHPPLLRSPTAGTSSAWSSSARASTTSGSFSPERRTTPGPPRDLGRGDRPSRSNCCSPAGQTPVRQIPDDHRNGRRSIRRCTMSPRPTLALGLIGVVGRACAAHRMPRSRRRWPPSAGCPSPPIILESVLLRRAWSPSGVWACSTSSGMPRCSARRSPSMASSPPRASSGCDTSVSALWSGSGAGERIWDAPDGATAA